MGGINHYQYAPNPVNWVDPFGLLCKEGEEKLDRMLSTLVSSDGIDKATKNKILEIAIASAVINDPQNRLLNIHQRVQNIEKSMNMILQALMKRMD